MWNLPLILSFSLVVWSSAYAELMMFQGSFDVDDEFKYHVAILRVLPNDTTEIICGGAIIDRRYVLTAAHCVYGREKKNLIVRSGWDLEPEKPEQERRSYHKVAKMMYPKDYFHSQCRNHQHDIAILKVEKSFDLTLESQYRKVNLPVSDNDFENYESTFSGYGIHKIRKYVSNSTREIVKEVALYSQQLKYITTRVISNEECQKNSSVIVTESNVCAQANNADGFSCLGDNGGPLVHDGVVIGIRNSHNNECIHSESEIFTRVSSYLDFIHKVLDHEHSYQIAYE